MCMQKTDRKYQKAMHCQIGRSAFLHLIYENGTMKVEDDRKKKSCPSLEIPFTLKFALNKRYIKLQGKKKREGITFTSSAYVWKLLNVRTCNTVMISQFYTSRDLHLHPNANSYEKLTSPSMHLDDLQTYLVGFSH